ncbi:hypothetical protein L228DRAFT_273913 [Xylona heveae TC161]|uniref:Zn(2)-C6 fungal-type domain-containing protein n=1 Tax=Xylona heveae (strain CBS 132557 / TC161) TaxID=1328760 RepID=A0A164ZU31_XYLHT|nr:hypothetical protein L228DRAFT_273913 [Xylona heveae TC161]KZF19518.1 hypothetical protein L228DRAFT_273913 [Xylona heveae TC161]
MQAILAIQISDDHIRNHEMAVRAAKIDGCDETKPSCLECVRRGLTCPGFRKRLKWRYMFNEVDQSVDDKSWPVAPEQENHRELDSASKPATPKEHHSSISPPSAQLSPKDRESDISKLDYFSVISPSSSPSEDASAINIPNIPSSEGLEQAPFAKKNAQPIAEPSRPDSLSVLHRLTSTTLQSPLTNLPETLVRYYFDYVCPIFSSFDSPTNPFRATIAQFWSRSAPIYFAVQSMAAASLANDFPGMRTVGIQMQQQAYTCLKEQFQGLRPALLDDHDHDHDDDDGGEIFFALLMVGSTTAWHNGADLAFVADWSPETSTANNDPAPPDAETRPPLYYLVNGKTLVHPWTGPLSRVLGPFYRTAKLVRSTRSSPSSSSDSMDIFWLDMVNILTETRQADMALLLEDELVALDLSSGGSPVPTGDPNTPASHFVALAEVYRCVALLQIYHVFPDVLVTRMRCTKAEPEPFLAHNIDFRSLFDFPRAKAFGLASLPVRDICRFLALHIVLLLDQLPITSGTRCMQPVLLAATAGSLNFSTMTQFSVGAHTLASFDPVNMEIAWARRRVKTRLLDLMNILQSHRWNGYSRLCAKPGQEQIWASRLSG